MQQDMHGSHGSIVTPEIAAAASAASQGDAGDLFMICLSMAVLVYMSMQLYRLYAYAYFSMDHYQTMMDMMK